MTQQRMQVNLISNVDGLPADDSTTSRDVLVDICCFMRTGPHIAPFTTYSPKVLGNAGVMAVVSGQGSGKPEQTVWDSNNDLGTCSAAYQEEG